MKKLYLLFSVLLGFSTSISAQQSYIKTPALTTTTSIGRAPNGTAAHTGFKACYLLSANEMSVVGTNTAINAIGFILQGGTNSPSVSGTMNIYLQNTTDGSYLKGQSFSTAIAPMTQVYNNTMVVPSGNFQQTITINLPSPFTYTGNGLYVAYEWVSTGPFATGAANYQCDNTMGNRGAISLATVAPAPDLMSLTNIGPCFRIGYLNTYTNEVQVYGVIGNGKQPLINGAPYSYSVILRNNSGTVVTNVVPTLSISGANAFVGTTTVASIAAGATVMAILPAYTPTAQGMNTVNVSIPNDDNNANNSVSVSQSVTCNYIGAAPPAPLSNFSLGVGFSTSSGLLLSKMSVPQTSSLTALRMGIANYNPNTGNSIYGVITNSSGIIIATTNTVSITGAMLGQYQPFYFNPAVAITGSVDYYIGMAQPANTVTAYFPLATWPTASNNILPTQYGTSFLGGGFIGVQTPTLGWFAIDGVFDNGISLTVTPQTNTICSGNSLTITASGATSYSWSNGASTSSIVVTPSVFTAYTCTGSAVVGTVGTCGDVKISNVYVNLTPTINCANGAICPVGNSYTLNPTGASTYTFSGGSNVVTPSVTTQYTITGTSAQGCPASNTVVATVSVSSNPTISIAGPTLVCIGTTTLIQASGAQSYTWNNGNTFSGINVSPTVTTTYSVVGAFGTCTTSASLNMSVSPTPSALGANTTNTMLCIGETATLVGSGAQNYSWSPGGATGLAIPISPTVTTTYTVYGNFNGICTNTATITQSVQSCIGLRENHNAFTEVKIFPNPNNGEFTIYVSNLTDNSVLQVYNTLGQVIMSEKLKDQSDQLNLRHLPKGLYIVKLKENDRTVKTVRVIIQ